MAPRPRLGIGRRDAPAAVLGRAQERREAGRGIEARPAQPVDRAIARDERGGLAVADQRVVFDAGGHQASWYSRGSRLDRAGRSPFGVTGQQSLTAKDAKDAKDARKSFTAKDAKDAKEGSKALPPRTRRTRRKAVLTAPLLTEEGWKR